VENESVPKRLRLRVIEIIRAQRAFILDQYYDAFCQRVCLLDRKKRGIEELRKICLPVRTRFSTILDRFTEVLRNDDLHYSYSLREGERDTEHAMRFVVPGLHHRLDTHDIIESTEGFVNTVATVLLSDTDPLVQSHRPAIEKLLNKLIYITFEDLWMTSVIGFRSQHGLIRQLLSKLMKVQEEERQNFWRDVHDDFLQVLAITMLKLEIIEELARKNVDVMKEEIEFLRRLINGSQQRLRNLCQGSNLSWFERRGLSFSLRAFKKVFEEQFGIPIKLVTRTGGEQIRGFQGVTLLRVAQEALFNIGRHSKAKSGKVDLKVADGTIHLAIEDDGVGFDARRLFRTNGGFGHLGLVFMKERVRLLNGSLDVTSAKGQGTKIAIRVPLVNAFAPGEVQRAGAYHE
jgi:signal transduction histidine kinase